MQKTSNDILGFGCGLSAALLLVFGGCSKSAGDGGATPRTPKEAASQLQQAFVNAPVEVKNDANVASEALRSADYEKAVQSLAAMKARQNLTLDQGVAVYNSMMALDARLIAAMEAGDPNAKRAWELLKRSKRD